MEIKIKIKIWNELEPKMPNQKLMVFQEILTSNHTLANRSAAASYLDVVVEKKMQIAR